MTNVLGLNVVMMMKILKNVSLGVEARFGFVNRGNWQKQELNF